ncbi:MAG: DNA replication/repair protein RecF [Acidimicrobiales bacterium]|nr:DNA replication/repair protein RecF [Acidimicrobiales bacterium]
MRLDRLHLRNFRSYREAEVDFSPGLTALVGRNGQGKTNVLEAIAYLSTFRSFRAATTEVLIRDGEDAAHLRAVGVRRGDRDVLLEAELNRSGRNRVQINRQRTSRPREAVGVLRTTLFAPDDLAIVKEGPQLRRTLVDELAAALDPRADGTLTVFERALRQRNALLKQCGGRLDAAAALTLDVWDAKLAPAGERLMADRGALVEALAPEVGEAYRALAGRQVSVEVRYRPSVAPGSFERALTDARAEDVRRSITTVGPHRDEVELLLRDAPVRTHGSQGEQRSFALALKLGGHRLVAATVGEPPLLLLDDVFSELDPQRCDALVANLPVGQTVLTSADRLPPMAVADVVHVVADGRIG